MDTINYSEAVKKMWKLNFSNKFPHFYVFYNYFVIEIKLPLFKLT